MNIKSLHLEIKRAIEKSDFSEFKSWIDKGADIHLLDSGYMCKTKDYSLIHWAIKVENLQILSFLIDSGVNYKQHIKEGSLLDFSIKVNSEEIIDYLMQLDFTKEEKETFLKNSIFKASIYHNTKKIEYILNNYPYDTNTKNIHGDTLLHSLSRKEDTLNTIKLLVNKGIDIELKDEKGWTALDYALYEMNKEIIHYLKEIGAKGDTSNTLTAILLLEAIEKKNVNYIQAYLDNGGDINILINKKDSITLAEVLLHEAIEENNVSYVQEYLDNGGDINIRIDKDYSTKTPLLILSIENNSDLISMLLIEKGVDVDLRDNYQSPPIREAAMMGQLNIVKKLLDAGADINDAGGDDEGAGTVLTSAVFYGHTEVVEFLLEQGVDINDVDFQGSTALHIAKYQENKYLEDLLLKYNPDLNILDDYGNKAMDIGL